MKKTFLTVLLFYIFTGIAVAQNLSKTTEYKILLTGASFASPQNGLVRNRLSQTECRSHKPGHRWRSHSQYSKPNGQWYPLL